MSPRSKDLRRDRGAARSRRTFPPGPPPRPGHRRERQKSLFSDKCHQGVEDVQVGHGGRLCLGSSARLSLVLVECLVHYHARLGLCSSSSPGREKNRQVHWKTASVRLRGTGGRLNIAVASCYGRIGRLVTLLEWDFTFFAAVCSFTTPSTSARSSSTVELSDN